MTGTRYTCTVAPHCVLLLLLSVVLLSGQAHVPVQANLWVCVLPPPATDSVSVCVMQFVRTVSLGVCECMCTCICVCVVCVCTTLCV